MNLKVISYSGETLNKESIISIRLMTKAWEITVLDDHAPLTSILLPWIVEIEYTDSNNLVANEQIAIWKWVIEISNSQVKILADMLVEAHEANREDAEKAIAQAEELMAKYKDSKDRIDMEKFVEAEDMLLKSIAKLKLSDLKK